jgi:hypothetical protein
MWRRLTLCLSIYLILLMPFWLVPSRLTWPTRRQLNKGQRAMAMAFAFPEPEKGGRGKKGKCEDSAGFSQRRLEQARQVLAHSKELAHRVLDGQLGLDAALKVVTEEQQKRQASQKKP